MGHCAGDAVTLTIERLSQQTCELHVFFARSCALCFYPSPDSPESNASNASKITHLETTRLTMAGLTWWSFRRPERQKKTRLDGLRASIHHRQKTNPGRYNYQSRLVALPFIFYGPQLGMWQSSKKYNIGCESPLRIPRDPFFVLSRPVAFQPRWNLCRSLPWPKRV